MSDSFLPMIGFKQMLLEGGGGDHKTLHSKPRRLSSISSIPPSWSAQLVPQLCPQPMHLAPKSIKYPHEAIFPLRLYFCSPLSIFSDVVQSLSYIIFIHSSCYPSHVQSFLIHDTRNCSSPCLGCLIVR